MKVSTCSSCSTILQTLMFISFISGLLLFTLLHNVAETIKHYVSKYDHLINSPKAVRKKSVVQNTRDVNKATEYKAKAKAKAKASVFKAKANVLLLDRFHNN